YCVTVIVKKAITKQYHENDDPDGAVIAQDSETDITSDGFNTCDVNNPRRVERELHDEYTATTGV
ncbi:hypothetical protein KW783_03545, partial [Candidatus Parcubacteria bacterium]|nr:hypothetical protein [Candidatus Parcubacteria bacterium]